MKLFIMYFSPFSCHLISLTYNILSTLCSDTLSLCSSLNVRDQVSHPYRTRGKIIVLYMSQILDILILSTHLLGLPSGLLPSGFSTNNLYALLFSPIRARDPARLILPPFIILIVLSEECRVHHYAVFSILLSPHLSSAQISSSAPCSQTPPAYVPPLMSETKSQTSRKMRRCERLES
jgi:hypothetical protein